MFDMDVIMSIFLITMVLVYIVFFVVQIRNIIKFNYLRNIYVIGTVLISFIVFILGIITPISFMYAICLSNICLVLLEIVELYIKRGL